MKSIPRLLSSIAHLKRTIADRTARVLTLESEAVEALVTKILAGNPEDYFGDTYWADGVPLSEIYLTIEITPHSYKDFGPLFDIMGNPVLDKALGISLKVDGGEVQIHGDAVNLLKFCTKQDIPIFGMPAITRAVKQMTDLLAALAVETELNKLTRP